MESQGQENPSKGERRGREGDKKESEGEGGRETEREREGGGGRREKTDHRVEE